MTSPLFRSLLDLSGMSLSSVFALVLVSISGVAVWISSTEKLDPREPPLARSRIPFIGHVIGLLSHHNNYFAMIKEKFPGPIRTLKIFSTRMYIISSPELTQAAYRSSKDISFDSIVKTASVKVVGLDQHGIDIVQYEPKEGESSYMLDLHHETYNALAKGSPLIKTNKRVLDWLARDLTMMGTTSSSRPLFRWIRDIFTTASAEMLYGSDNPVARDPNFIQVSWDFEGDLGMLALGIMPSVIAPKGYAARNVATKAFQEYYDTGLGKNANELVQGRERAARAYGLTTEEISKTEISILSASVTNTVPNTLYMVSYVFADLELIASLRQEISKIVTRSSQNGVDILTLDHTMIESQCPLLVSCYYETLRLNKTGASIRAVVSDTMLNNQYLLKEGSLIQIATGVMHFDKETWGADANVFNSQRFLNKDSLSKDVRKIQNQAFIPFGGGKSTCPGRYLALTEITSFVAMLVYGFDVSLNDGSALRIPERRFQKMGIASMSPKDDMDVLIQRRREFENVTWKFKTG